MASPVPGASETIAARRVDRGTVNRSGSMEAAATAAAVTGPTAVNTRMPIDRDTRQATPRGATADTKGLRKAERRRMVSNPTEAATTIGLRRATAEKARAIASRKATVAGLKARATAMAANKAPREGMVAAGTNTVETGAMAEPVRGVTSEEEEERSTAAEATPATTMNLPDMVDRSAGMAMTRVVAVAAVATAQAADTRLADMGEAAGMAQRAGMVVVVVVKARVMRKRADIEGEKNAVAMEEEVTLATARAAMKDDENDAMMTTATEWGEIGWGERALQ